MTQLRILPALFLLLLSAPLTAQTANIVRQPAPGAPAPAPAPPTVLPSAILRPAMQSLQQALALAHPEKWKAPSAITAESVSDISSIQRDLDQTLPPLVAASDAGASSVAQLLPTYRNVEALYDVLVRVTQTSVLAAPAPQSIAFQQATQSLQQARRDFGDLIDSTAQSQDRHLHDVQTKLTALQSAPPPPPPAPCPPPPPVKKTRPHAKPARKPTTPPPSTSQ